MLTWSTKCIVMPRGECGRQPAVTMKKFSEILAGVISLPHGVSTFDKDASSLRIVIGLHAVFLAQASSSDYCRCRIVSISPDKL
jgi:hypothetical protein